MDLRWREPSTGEYRRYRERFPPSMPAPAAKARAREILAAALAGGFVPRKEGPKRLSQAVKRYLEWAEVNRSATICDRESRTRTLTRHLGDPQLDDLSAFRIERYKRDRLREKARSAKSNRTVQPATVNREVTLLKHLCGMAASWGWMSKDIADAIRNEATKRASRSSALLVGR